MSIVAVEKVTLCGPLKAKSAMLSALQTLGLVHLVPLRPGDVSGEEPSERPEAAYRALRWLLDNRERRLQVVDAEDFDFDAVVAAVEHNRRALMETRNRLEKLLAQRQLLEPWGRFEPPVAKQFGGLGFWYYIVPLRQFEQMDKEGLTWAVVKRDLRQVYLIVISEQEPPRNRMLVRPVPLGHLSLDKLEHLIERARQRIEELEFERLSLTRWISLLGRDLARAEDRAALNHARSITRDETGLFVLHGWLAQKDRPRLEQYVVEQGLAAFFEAPAPSDLPPTLLSNPPALAAGEDLAGFFQTPSYVEWDPSRVLFFSFAAFFAMIIADAGYALLLTAGLLAFWKKLGRKPTLHRLRTLAATMLGAAVVYGVMVGSYFGVAPAAGTLAAHLKILDLNDFDTMLRLSVFIGVAHLLLANSLRALHYWPSRIAKTALGWNGLLVAGFTGWLAATGVVPEGLIVWCWGLGIVSGLMVFAWASQRRVTNLKDAVLRVLDGLGALTRLTKAFGDVLSYMRLFALGLASASLALTFNQIASNVVAALPGLGVFLAVLILMLGHVLNLTLAVVSGVVHGLRLNFIEFYNWGLSEEGYPFRPFRRKEIHHE